MSTNTNAPAGWYPPDPTRPNDIRYWDGFAWTDAKHSYYTGSPAQDFLPDVVTSTPVTRAGSRPWYTTWPAIIVGYLFFVAPGVVALWLRRGPSVANKWVGTAVGAMLLLLPIAGGIGDEAETPARADGPSASPSESPRVSSSASEIDDATWAANFETGAPATLAEGDVAQIEQMGRWGKTLAESSFPGSYVKGSGNPADQMEALAVSYPVPTSPVVQQLHVASGELAQAQTALDEKQYDDAAAHFDAAEEALALINDQFLQDLATVETSTGYRFAGDGVVSSDAETTTATIEGWIDGDTVETSAGQVRLIGVDAPDMNDACSDSRDAKRLAEVLAPVDSEVNLVNPASVSDTDADGRELRYADLADGTDVGYTLLLNDLARARYDSQDGYQWHPREKAYRDAETEPTGNAACTWAAAQAFVAVANGDDDDEQHRAESLDKVALGLAASAVLVQQVDDARAQHKADAKEAAAKKAAAKKAAAKKAAAKKKASGGSSSEPWNRPGPDLNCSDIGHMVQITGPDYHDLDRDGDGWGCDSYG